MIHTQIPDFPGLICASGAELRMHLENHLELLGIPYFLNAGVEKIEQSSDGFVIKRAKEKLVARSVIIATGVARRRFSLADSFVGSGISYTASGAIDLFQGTNHVRFWVEVMVRLKMRFDCQRYVQWCM